MGERIAKLRQSAGMSQAELARRINISSSALGMYEQGRRDPPGDILIALAKELGVTTDYLLTGIPDIQAFYTPLQGMLRGMSVSRQEMAVLLAAMMLDL